MEGRMAEDMSRQQFHEVNGAQDDVAVNRLVGPREPSAWAEHAAAAEAWERQHAAEWAKVDQKLRGIPARQRSHVGGEAVSGSASGPSVLEVAGRRGREGHTR